MSREDPQAGLVEVGANGAYRFDQEVALVATQAAGSILFAMRWGDATHFMVLNRLKLVFMQNVAATASFLDVVNVAICRSFTASDTGGTACPSPPRTRTSMGFSLITDMRFSGAAAGLAAGTRTPDLGAIMRMPFELTSATIEQASYTEIFDATDGWTHPIVFAQNEGFEITNVVGFPAAGSGALEVIMDWAEVDAY